MLAINDRRPCMTLCTEWVTNQRNLAIIERRIEKRERWRSLTAVLKNECRRSLTFTDRHTEKRMLAIIDSRSEKRMLLKIWHIRSYVGDVVLLTYSP